MWRCLACLSGFHVAFSTNYSPLLPIRLQATSSGNRRFVDGAGRERIFHGTNAVSKGPPWVPATDAYSTDLSMVEEDFALLASQGFNVLRLGTMWPGIEPARGEYNESYLDELEKIADGAARYGIYTILDMHQDVLSEKFCGEGIPAWAAEQLLEGLALDAGFPQPFGKPFGGYYNEPKSGGSAFPTRRDCAKMEWAEYYATKATSAAFERLYTNVNGTGDAWAAAWAKVAERFKGRSNILGLELWNEPWGGDLYKDPLIMVPSISNAHNADRSRLEPAYNRINAKVREVDDERLIFFAGVPWDNFGPGFDAPPGGPDYANRSVLAYHCYEPPQLDTRMQLNAFADATRKLRTGGFLTETFGGRQGDAFDIADEWLASWAWWEYKSFCRETNETFQSDSQNALEGACKTGIGPTQPVKAHRTFAQAVAGNLTSMKFDSYSRTFRMEYNIDPACRLPTEIAVQPAINYPGGFLVDILPEGIAAWKYDAAKEPKTIFVVPLPSASFGKKVVVTVKAKGKGDAWGILV